MYLYFLSFFNTNMAQMVIQYSQYHGCWWPGDTRSQDISNHGIDLLFFISCGIFHERNDLISLHRQYHGCWWSGDARSQGICNNGIDIVFPYYSIISTIWVNEYWWNGRVHSDDLMVFDNITGRHTDSFQCPLVTTRLTPERCNCVPCVEVSSPPTCMHTDVDMNMNMNMSPLRGHGDPNTSWPVDLMTTTLTC